MIFFQYATLRDLLNPVFMNRRPGEQILQNATVNCLPGWKEPDCQTCAQGWKKPDCQTCAKNFGPPGDCTSCVRGWAGENCNICETNFGHQTDSCQLGWAGENFDVCDFGFSAKSCCTECIQNGIWNGTWDGTYPMVANLTFEAPACTHFQSGKPQTFNNKSSSCGTFYMYE